MRIVGIFALTVGVAMLVGVLPLFIYEHRVQREAQAELAMFEADIEAWQDSLMHASTVADSVDLRERIVGRQEGVGRLSLHVTLGRTALRGWWRPTGPGGQLLMAGVLLLVLGWYALVRAVNARWNLPPLDERYRTQG